jgi:crotonobetainyl-CoA:carnitine CoA-transferase CaiB-like acyl-CoA transferase
MTQALAGLRVVDFGQYIAGPLTAMLLGDQGADIVHVDPPGGPRWQTPANAVWNRGKRSIQLDLRQSSDLASARELISSADVVVENFRPGVMERLGLGASQSMDQHPRLVYCSLPGFAADDPRAGIQAWEGIVAAATGTYGPPDAESPSFTPVAISSHFAAFQAAVAIAMALIAREHDGGGQHIEMPLFDATFAAIGAAGLIVDGQPGGIRPDDFWTGLFECADGRWVQVSAATPRFRDTLARALHLEDWLADGYFDVERLNSSASLREELHRRQPALFRSRSAQAWEDLGGQVGVPIILCRSTPEWVAHPHARAAGIIRNDGQPGAPIRMGDTGPRLRATPMQAGRTVLESVRVLDLSQVLAGPTTGRTLAEYGADVVKINNPHEQGAGIHFSRHRYHTDVNRGKRSLLLDLKTTQGQSILKDLVSRSDVLLQNFRPDAAQRLGVTYQAIRQIRPDIVYVTVSAFGEPGPWQGWPGYEVQAQAASGLRYAQHGRPHGQPFAVNDYGTGLMGAFAAALALYQRERTSAGQQVEAALAYTATILQSPILHRESVPEDNALGWSADHRLERTAHGWEFVAPNVSQPLVRIENVMRDAWVVEHGLSITREHDGGEVVTTVGPAARLSRTPVQPGVPAPVPGADAASVLRDISRENDLEALLHDGIIAIERAAQPSG